MREALSSLSHIEKIFSNFRKYLSIHAPIYFLLPFRFKNLAFLRIIIFLSFFLTDTFWDVFLTLFVGAFFTRDDILLDVLTILPKKCREFWYFLQIFKKNNTFMMQLLSAKQQHGGCGFKSYVASNLPTNYTKVYLNKESINKEGII